MKNIRRDVAHEMIEHWEKQGKRERVSGEEEWTAALEAA